MQFKKTKLVDIFVKRRNEGVRQTESASKAIEPTKDIKEIKSKIAILCREVFNDFRPKDVYPKGIALYAHFVDNTIIHERKILSSPVKSINFLYYKIMDMFGEYTKTEVDVLKVTIFDMHYLTDKEKITYWLDHRRKLEKPVKPTHTYNFNKEEPVCPICQKTVIVHGNNAVLNRHIDRCLNGETEMPKRKKIRKRKRN